MRDETHCRLAESFFLICKIPLTQVVAHWLEREIAQSVHQVGSIWHTMSGCSTTELHPAPHVKQFMKYLVSNGYLFIIIVIVIFIR